MERRSEIIKVHKLKEKVLLYYIDDATGSTQGIDLSYPAYEALARHFETGALEICTDELGDCNMLRVTNCVALPEWLSKERCAVAAGIWNSHQEGDNKRVQAIKQIKEWAAESGYEIGFKKANELFKQHCL